MSNLTAILRYQETDKKLFALERELASCKERKEFLKSKKFLEGAAERLDSLEMKARALKEKAAEAEQRCAAIEKDLSEFSGIDELINGGADVSYYKKAAQRQMETLRKEKADLNAIVAEIEGVDKDFKKLKKEVLAEQKNYTENKESYDAVKASREDEKKALEGELAEIAKTIEKAALERYMTKRKEKVFPVVYPLTADGRCGACSMDIPLAAMSAVDSDGTIECENCRRILYRERE